MALTNVVDELSDEDRAREPRDLGVIAYFDGYTAGSGQGRRFDYPRVLTRSEETCWRAGFAEGRRERVCHSWHGFTPCEDDHPVTPRPSGEDPQ